jgi:hypothetical protein
MATTVEATSAKRDAAPAAGTPWYKDRTRQLALAVGAVVVIALGAWLVITSGRRKEAFAQRMLSQAIATADRGNYGQASAELQRVIQTYRGTQAAGEAVLALNWVRVNNNQGAIAQQDLRKRTRAASPRPLPLTRALPRHRRWPTSRPRTWSMPAGRTGWRGSGRMPSGSTGRSSRSTRTRRPPPKPRCVWRSLRPASSGALAAWSKPRSTVDRGFFSGVLRDQPRLHG